MTEILTAAITGLVTAFGAWLVYRRGTRRDTSQQATKKERSLSEGWMIFAEHMEVQLRATQEDLSAVRSELVACQQEARNARDEAYVVRRLADSLEDEVESLRKRMNHLEQ